MDGTPRWRQEATHEPRTQTDDDERVAPRAAPHATDFRQATSRGRTRPTLARYLVAELEPTIWRLLFELSFDDLAEAFEAVANRATLHVHMYGEPRPMILLDRQTNTILRSASDAVPSADTMPADLSAWLEEGQPDAGDRDIAICRRPSR